MKIETKFDIGGFLSVPGACEGEVIKVMIFLKPDNKKEIFYMLDSGDCCWGWHGEEKLTLVCKGEKGSREVHYGKN